MTLFDAAQGTTLAVVLVVLVARSLQLRWKEGVTVLTLGRGKPAAQAALELSFAVAFPAWVLAVGADVVGSSWNVWPSAWDLVLLDHSVAKSVGAVLLLGSVSLLLWALQSFGSAWRVGIDAAAPATLVQRGVFAYSRNPIFVVMDVYAFATFLVQGTLFYLLSAVVLAAGLHCQIRAEERFLERHHGDVYRRYRARVPRYLGPRAAPSTP